MKLPELLKHYKIKQSFLIKQIKDSFDIEITAARFSFCVNSRFSFRNKEKIALKQILTSIGLPEKRVSRIKELRLDHD